MTLKGYVLLFIAGEIVFSLIGCFWLFPLIFAWIVYKTNKEYGQ